MKPIWKDGKLSVELHIPDRRDLEKARAIGQALGAMNQPEGAALVQAVDAILDPEEADE